MSESNASFLFIGSVVRVGELRYSPDGETAFLDVDLAVQDSYKNDGEDDFKSIKTYPRVKFIGAMAENAVNNLYEHRDVVVRGSIRQTKYEDNNGNDVYGYQFNVKSIKYFGKSKKKHDKK